MIFFAQPLDFSFKPLSFSVRGGRVEAHEAPCRGTTHLVLLLQLLNLQPQDVCILNARSLILQSFMKKRRRTCHAQSNPHSFKSRDTLAEITNTQTHRTVVFAAVARCDHVDKSISKTLQGVLHVILYKITLEAHQRAVHVNHAALQQRRAAAQAVALQMLRNLHLHRLSDRIAGRRHRRPADLGRRRSK